MTTQPLIPVGKNPLGTQFGGRRHRKHRKTHSKRGGGVLGTVFNQAVAPFTLFAMQHLFSKKTRSNNKTSSQAGGKRRKGGKKTRKSRR